MLTKLFLFITNIQDSLAKVEYLIQLGSDIECYTVHLMFIQIKRTFYIRHQTGLKPSYNDLYNVCITLMLIKI